MLRIKKYNRWWRLLNVCCYLHYQFPTYLCDIWFDLIILLIRVNNIFLKNVVNMFLHICTKHKSIQYNCYQLWLRHRCGFLNNDMLWQVFLYTYWPWCTNSSLQRVLGMLSLLVGLPLNHFPEVIFHRVLIRTTTWPDVRVIWSWNRSASHFLVLLAVWEEEVSFWCIYFPRSTAWQWCLVSRCKQ